MDTILSYLDNMFLHLPQTDEVLRAKQELANMMEDKFNELIAEGKRENEAVGIVISEFGNLDELAEELGISKIMNQSYSEAPAERRVSREEAEQYMEDSKGTSKWISFGVMLCILSPVALFYLGGLQEMVQGISDGKVVLFGLIPLLMMIAIAVAIFIYQGMKMEKYEYLKKECIQIDSSLRQYLQTLKEQEKPKSTLMIIVGVMLCIFSVMPLLVIGAMFENDMYSIYSLIFLFLVVSIAVWFFIAGGSRMEAIKVLLQEGDFTKEGKKSSKIIDVISGIYWPIITAVYLGWSLVTMNWGFTWIVWPIAGIVFGAIATICNVVQNSIDSTK